MKKAGLFLLAVALLVTATNVAAVTLEWMRTYNGAANNTDEGWSVAVAADGSIYVTGDTYVEGQSFNLLLRKYTANGAFKWMRTYNGASNGWDVGKGVAVAADGNIYATGWTYVEGQSDNLLLRKYSPTGAVRWTKTYHGVPNGAEAGLGVAVAADGSIYVTGWTDVEGQARVSLLLQKYSSSGALRWTKTYHGAYYGRDVGKGVAVAADGSIYVTGMAYVEGQSDHLLLQKYSPSGALCWTRTYRGAYDSPVESNGVAVAADGSIYVTGWTNVKGSSFNLLLRKYSPTGALRWTKTYGGASNSLEMGEGVAVAAGGSIYVTGHTHVDGQAGNLLLRTFTPTGAPRWTKTYNGASNSWDGGMGVAVAADGSIYVTGRTDVEGQSGNLLLQKYR